YAHWSPATFPRTRRYTCSCCSSMLAPATPSPSCSPAAASPPDALGQVPPHHLHGDLVRGTVLPAAALRLSRDGRGHGLARALQAHGAQALLGHHDSRRRAHPRLRGLAVARLVPRRRELATREDGARRAARRLPPVVRHAAARFRRRPQREEP